MLKNLFGKGKDKEALAAYNAKIDQFNELTEGDKMEHATLEEMPSEDEAETLEAMILELQPEDTEVPEEDGKENEKKRESKTKVYKQPKMPKFTTYKAAPREVVKKGKKYSGTGMVDFVTNGKSKILGKEGKVWPTPADRAQSFVDRGMGEITGINEEWAKAQKKAAAKKSH